MAFSVCCDRTLTIHIWHFDFLYVLFKQDQKWQGDFDIYWREMRTWKMTHRVQVEQTTTGIIYYMFT